MIDQSLHKNAIIFSLMIMAAITQAGLVLYTPAFLQISQDLHISSSLVELTLTCYLFGFGISQLFYGPLSDRFGRKKLILVGMLIFSIACLWSIFVETYSTFFLSRIVQGIGAGSCMTLSRAILRDCFSGTEYIKVATYLSSGFAIGLGLTPVIGGHLLDYFSWRSEFVFLFGCGLIVLISLWKFLPETHIPKLPLLSFKEFSLLTAKNFYFISKNKSFICYLIGGVAAYGIIIAYNTMAPFLFQKTMGYSASLYGWLTFIIAVTYYLSTISNRIFLSLFTTNTMIKIGIMFILIAGLAMLICKFIFTDINFYIVFIPLMVATFGQALIWSISIAGALKDLSHVAGTAAALFSCLQMLLSTLISGLISIPHTTNQIPLAIVIVLLALVSWIVFYIGVFNIGVFNIRE